MHLSAGIELSTIRLTVYNCWLWTLYHWGRWLHSCRSAAAEAVQAVEDDRLCCPAGPRSPDRRHSQPPDPRSGRRRRPAVRKTWPAVHKTRRPEVRKSPTDRRDPLECNHCGLHRQLQGDRRYRCRQGHRALGRAAHRGQDHAQTEDIRVPVSVRETPSNANRVKSFFIWHTKLIYRFTLATFWHCSVLTGWQLVWKK